MAFLAIRYFKMCALCWAMLVTSQRVFKSPLADPVVTSTRVSARTVERSSPVFMFGATSLSAAQVYGPSLSKATRRSARTVVRSSGASILLREMR